MASVMEEFGGIDVGKSRPFEEVKKGYVQFRERDVLFAKITPCMENGKVGVVPKLDSEVGYGSTEFHILRAPAEVDPRWIAHFVSREEFRRAAKRNMSGSAGQLRVPAVWLSEQSIPVPPPKEQQRVVAKLEELISDLEAGTVALERARANLKRYRAAVLKAAVEGRLTEKWRATHLKAEPAEKLLERILIERRKKWEEAQVTKYAEKGQSPPKGWKDKYQEPAKPDVASLPALPKGWCWATMEQLVARSEYGTSVKCDYDAHHEPVLRIPNIAGGRIDLADMKRATVSLKLTAEDALKPGDLLVCRTNGSVKLVGKAALVEGVLEPLHSFASYLLRLRFVLGVDVARWVWLLLTSQPGRSFIEAHAASSAGQHNVSLSLLHGMPVPLAPIEKQRVASTEVDRLLSVQEIATRDTELRLRHAGVLRQAILKRAFEGKLVPQDPKDEPASELLARIWAARLKEKGQAGGGKGAKRRAWRRGAGKAV